MRHGRFSDIAHLVHILLSLLSYMLCAYIPFASIITNFFYYSITLGKPFLFLFFIYFIFLIKRGQVLIVQEYIFDDNLQQAI